MNIVFADTFYFFALLSKSDEAHDQAVEFARTYRGKIVTSEWVLTEVGDGLASTRIGRESYLRVRDGLRKDSRVSLVAFSELILNAAISLYAERLDKEWSLTDCTSFIIMGQNNIAGALTGDHHFEQAGFIALFG